jgi:hypothetical protein
MAETLSPLANAYLKHLQGIMSTGKALIRPDSQTEPLMTHYLLASAFVNALLLSKELVEKNGSRHGDVQRGDFP